MADVSDLVKFFNHLIKMLYWGAGGSISTKRLRRCGTCALKLQPVSRPLPWT
jgi:hypothetical protein